MNIHFLRFEAEYDGHKFFWGEGEGVNYNDIEDFYSDETVSAMMFIRDCIDELADEDLDALTPELVTQYIKEEAEREGEKGFNSVRWSVNSISIYTEEQLDESPTDLKIFEGQQRDGFTVTRVDKLCHGPVIINKSTGEVLEVGLLASRTIKLGAQGIFEPGTKPIDGVWYQGYAKCSNREVPVDFIVKNNEIAKVWDMSEN